jgi:hypothetical protein
MTPAISSDLPTILHPNPPKNQISATQGDRLWSSIPPNHPSSNGSKSHQKPYDMGILVILKTIVLGGNFPSNRF